MGEWLRTAGGATENRDPCGNGRKARREARASGKSSVGSCCVIAVCTSVVLSSSGTGPWVGHVPVARSKRDPVHMAYHKLYCIHVLVLLQYWGFRWPKSPECSISRPTQPTSTVCAQVSFGYSRKRLSEALRDTLDFGLCPLSFVHRRWLCGRRCQKARLALPGAHSHLPMATRPSRRRCARTSRSR